MCFILFRGFFVINHDYFPTSLKHKKYKSLFSPKRTVRENPQILEGYESELSLSLFLGNNPLEIQVVPENGVVARLDYSSKKLRSDFDFRRLRIIGMVKSKTFFNELFVSPYIHMILDAGILSGKYGPQHLLTPNAALAFYSPFGTLKGLKPYQYVGDKMITLQVEHNWRSIPFQSIGLDFMSDLHIDILTGASGMKLWNDSNYFNELKMTENLYWEIYLGIYRIFAVSIIDFSYSSIIEFQATVSIAVLL